MSDPPAILADGLTKRYGDELAVTDLNLSIEAGTVYGFLGPNGAGKTTTMRMLTTLTRPTRGTARIQNAPITDRAAVRSVIGYLPEDPPIFDELTGREQLLYFARLRNIPRRRAVEKIDEWLRRFSLEQDADKRTDDYSKGMRQKVGLVQALVHDPSVVFLDEPTSGLDPRAARTVIDSIDELAGTGRTIFLSTHILPVVEELADTVGVLDDGRLVAQGSPESLVASDDESLESVFLDVTTE